MRFFNNCFFFFLITINVESKLSWFYHTFCSIQETSENNSIEQALSSYLQPVSEVQPIFGGIHSVEKAWGCKTVDPQSILWVALIVYCYDGAVKYKPKVQVLFSHKGNFKSHLETAKRTILKQCKNPPHYVDKDCNPTDQSNKNVYNMSNMDFRVDVLRMFKELKVIIKILPIK